jgi:DNA polymerase III alpha subunit
VARYAAQKTSSSKTTAGRQDTYALLETETVFQFESVGMQRMLRTPIGSSRPEAMNALYRPGRWT